MFFLFGRRGRNFDIIIIHINLIIGAIAVFYTVFELERQFVDAFVELLLLRIVSGIVVVNLVMRFTEINLLVLELKSVRNLAVNRNTEVLL